MSDIQLVGTLLDPVGNPIQWAIIRFTALTTEGDTFEGADASGQSDASGQYDFTVQQGRYRLEILYSDEYIESGEVLIDEHTPTGITLQELVRYTSPYTPPLVLDTDPNWALLLQGVIDGDEWNRQEESQVRDKEVLVNDDKAIHKDGEAYVAKRTHSASTGSAASTHEQVTYEDNAHQKASASTQEDVVGTGKATHTQGIYQSSDGSQEAVSDSSLVTDTGSITEGKVVSESLVSSESTQQGNSVTRIKSDRAEATYTDDEGQPNATPRGKAEKSLKLSQGVHEAEVTSEEVVRYVEADEVVEALLKQGIKIKYAKPDGFPMEYFEEMTVNKEGGTKTTQIDRMLVQARDGFPVMDIDTENREIVLDAKLTFQNTDDFIGEEGFTYAWKYQFSKDKGITDPWHDEYDADHPDIWRKDQQVKWQGEDQRNYQLVGAPEIIQLNAEDGLAGDNFYMEEQYTTDAAYPSGWDTTYTNGDDWRRWRTIRITATGTEISDWTESRLKGTDGPSGWIPEWETYYGRSATAPFDQDEPENTYGSWSKNLTDSDVYKWERTVWWKSQADFEAARNAQGGIDWDIAPAAGSSGIWIGPTKIKPVAGEDYGDKTAQLFLYKRGTTMPTEPPEFSYDFTSQTLSPTGGNWEGWGRSVIDGSGFLYVATGTAFSKGSTDPSIDNWDVDRMTKDGLKSSIAYLWQVRTKEDGAPPLPSITLTYDFLTLRVKGDPAPNNGWVTTMPSNALAGNQIWQTVAPVTAEAHEDVEDIAVDDWEEAAILSQNGEDGGAGDSGYQATTIMLYRSVAKATNVSALPTPTGTLRYNFVNKSLTTAPNNGWSESIPPNTGILVVTAAVAGGLAGEESDDIGANEWSTPVEYSVNGDDGENGLNVAQVLLYQTTSLSGTAPTTPTGNNTFNFAQGRLTTTPNNGWSQTIENSLGIIWVTHAVAIASADNNTDTIPASEWGTPEVLARNGVDGENGEHGVGSYIFRSSNLPESDEDIDDAILWHQENLEMASNPPKGGEIATWIVSGSSNDTDGARYYIRDVGTASPTALVRWAEFSYVFDGDVLVDGTLAAQKLKAKTITGDKVSSETTLIAGSGNSTAGMNGGTESSYNGYRFWSGAVYPADASFSVTDKGILKAVGADISGKITAESGSFTGEILAKSGTLENVTIEADCTVKGTLQGADGTFDGTVYAQNLEGDVIDTGLFSFPSSHTVTDQKGNKAWLLNGGSSLSDGGEYTITSVTIPAEKNFNRKIRLRGNWGIIHDDGNDVIKSGALRIYIGSTKVYDSGTVSTVAGREEHRVFSDGEAEISITASTSSTVLIFKFYCASESGNPSRAYVSVSPPAQYFKGQIFPNFSMQKRDNDSGEWVGDDDSRITSDTLPATYGLEYELFKTIPKKYFNS